MPQPRSALLPLLCVLALVGAAGALARTGTVRTHRARAQAARSCGPTRLMPTRRDIRQFARITFCLINRQRTSHGLRPLRFNAALARSAARHSADMVAHGYFSHDSRDGASPFQRILDSGYAGHRHACALGENIAAGEFRMGSPAAIVNMWMNSPGHRDNILSASYRDSGVGVAYGFPGTHARGATFTQDFGRRC
jgi:uncharacterized protein YkwD